MRLSLKKITKFFLNKAFALKYRDRNDVKWPLGTAMINSSDNVESE